MMVGRLWDAGGEGAPGAGFYLFQFKKNQQ